jgi:hypothetical protein
VPASILTRDSIDQMQCEQKSGAVELEETKIEKKELSRVLGKKKKPEKQGNFDYDGKGALQNQQKELVFLQGKLDLVAAALANE